MNTWDNFVELVLFVPAWIVVRILLAWATILGRFR